MDDLERSEILAFRIGGRAFGLPAAFVSELARPGADKLCPVPGAPHYFLGLASVRGRIVPTISGERLLGLKERPREGIELIIVWAGESEIALAARASDMRIVKAELRGMEAGEKHAAICQGVIDYDGERAPVLDPKKLYALQVPHTRRADEGSL